MTKEQKLFKALIMADLKLAEENCFDDDKAIRLQAAYHAQQAVEKTIKLKAELGGLNLWGHDIDVLLKKCDDNGINVDVPKYLRDKADVITHWEAECRYYPITVVRKDSIKKVVDVVKEWLNQGKTK